MSATTCTDYNAYCDGAEACISGGAAVDLGKSCDVFSLPEQTCAMAIADAVGAARAAT